MGRTGWTTRAAVAVAALVAVAGAQAADARSGTAGARAVDPAGPELREDCFWVGPRGRDFKGGARAANNYPDADATYWFARFTLPEGARLELDGTFPHARYLSLSSYAGREPAGSLHDAEIAPLAGHANPFLPGARRDARRRGYVVSVVPGAVPADPAPNTLYAGTPGQSVVLVYRVYVNDRGTDVAGDGGLPQPTVVAADGTRTTGDAACALVNDPDRTDQTRPPMTLAQWEALITTPGLDPAVAPATRLPRFQRFFNGAYNFVGDFRPETQTTRTPPDTGGAFSNADTRYVYASLSRRFGPVAVLRGTLPTTPDTVDGQRVMGTGQLRYWSLCTNETPVSGQAVDCVTDHDVALRGDRRYTIVISRPEDRPANATRRCGVTWLDWGRQTESPMDPDYGLLLLRNMVPDPGFAHAAQRVTTLGTEREVMGEYLPRGSYATSEGFEARGCARRERRSAPRALAAAMSAAAKRAYRAGLRAFVHGFPPILHRLSQETFPPNTLVSIADLTEPQDRLVVLPNVDTAYSVGKLDLRGGPMVLHVPDHGDRYFVFQLMDAYTNVVDYVGTRRTGRGPGDYAIVGPGDTTPIPAGMPVIQSPTNDALLLGRTLVDGPQELPAVKPILQGYALTPLADLQAGGAPKPSVVLDDRPVRADPVLPPGLAFFDALNQILAEDPPTAAEAKALAPLRRYGIGAGLTASTTPMPADVRAALERAVRDGREHLQAIVDRRRAREIPRNDGWSLLDPDTGDAGTDWTLRAMVALIGLWANTPEEATYPMAADDSEGRPLTGRHRYALTFEQPPPAKAFWSLTMYGEDRFLVANPIDRYAVGDRTGLREAKDGSITIRLQHRRPQGATTNWLPAPKGRFLVSLRLYVPTKAVLTGRWTPPGIRCLDCGPARPR